MKFLTFLEAFDKPYKVHKGTDMNNFTQYEFTTDSDVFYLVALVRPDEAYVKYTSLSFETEYGDMQITNSGDAFRVFASVLDVIKKEKKRIVSHGAFKFAADASEPSRVKLYRIMAKKIQKLLGYKKLSVEKNSNHIEFMFWGTK